MHTRPAGAARPAPPVSRAEGWSVAALTAAFLLIVTLWAVLTPLYDAPDEPLHLNSAVRLAEGGGWPDPGDAELDAMILGAMAEAGQPAETRSTFAELRAANPGYNGLDQMTQHPPLYYLYAAGVLTVIDFMDVRADLALLAVRLSGLLFALPWVFLSWASVRRLTGSPRAALVAAAAPLAVPQLAHILGAVSNDGLTAVMGAVIVYFGVRAMTGDRGWLPAIGMGSALAVALLTKATALPMIAFVGIVLLLWPASLPLRSRIARTAVGAAVSLAGGWWWVRNILVYGSLQPPGLLYAENPWPEGGGPDWVYFSDQLWVRISNSFWGNFGWLTSPIPSVITDVITVVCAGVIVGWGIRRAALLRESILFAALSLLYVLALVSQTWPSYVRSQLPAGMQGRYFFIILIPLVLLSAIAWMRMVPRHAHRRASVGIVIAAALMVAEGLYVGLRGFYPAGATNWLARSPLGGWETLALTGAAGAVTAAAVVVAIVLVARRGTLDRADDPAPAVTG